MSQLSIHEQSKMRNTTLMSEAVIETFESESPLLNSITVRELGLNNTLAFDREATLPTTSGRGYNGIFQDITAGSSDKRYEATTIIGGEVVIDERQVAKDSGARTRQERALVKSLALNVTDQFINGNTATNQHDYDGLKRRVEPQFVFPANLDSPAANSPLSLNALSKAMQEVRRPTHIIMSPDMRRLVSNAAKSDLGGQIRVTKDEFGYQVFEYDGLPIIEADYNRLGERIIDFNEAGPAGGTDSSSIYVVRMDDFDGVSLIQSGGILVNDIGKMETRPGLMTRIDWEVGMATMTPYCVSQIWGISDGAVTK